MIVITDRDTCLAIMLLHGSETAEMTPPLFLRELLASIRARRLRRQEGIDEEGAEITRRLQELLGARKPGQIEPFSTKAPHSENDSGHTYRGKTGT